MVPEFPLTTGQPRTPPGGRDRDARSDHLLPLFSQSAAAAGPRTYYGCVTVRDWTGHEYLLLYRASGVKLFLCRHGKGRRRGRDRYQQNILLVTSHHDWHWHGGPARGSCDAVSDLVFSCSQAFRRVFKILPVAAGGPVSRSPA